MPDPEPTIIDPPASWAHALLRLAGWRVRYQGTPPGCGVVIAYPHTSNWDFVVGIVTIWAVGIPLAFLGKASLFRIPLLGALLRRWGGLPVHRGQSRGLIGEMAERLRAGNAAGQRWWLGMAPEGTRRREDTWRSGFYHMAVQAGVPIGLAFFNFRDREVGVVGFLMPSGDIDADMARIDAMYRDQAFGCRPGLASPIRVRERAGDRSQS